MRRLLLPAAALIALAACREPTATDGVAGDPAGGAGSGGASGSAVLSLASGAPSQLIAGESAVIGGTGFSTTRSDNVVTLAGVPLVVTAATASTLTVTVPTAFPCGPARTVSLSVSARGAQAARDVVLRAARPRPLAPGESAIFGEADRCVELPTAGSRYMVAVVHSGRAVSAIAPFEVVGSTAASPGVAAAPAAAAALASPSAATWSGDVTGGTRAAPPTDGEGLRRRETLHHRILETNRGLRARLGAPGRAGQEPGVQVSASVSASPGELVATTSVGPTSGLRAVGDTATLRIPDINSSSACSKYFTVRTRVVYSSAHAIIVEDVTAPLAGRIDATYASIGEEFERVMWPILTASFGDPLAMDSRLDRNGRIVMLFSPVVNDNFDGIAGFVIGCDFYLRSQAQSSNEGEVFYAGVPTSLLGGTGAASSPEGWRRTMRSTIIHEAKHITAYAERISRGYAIEESWLEEGTARHAEELYARAIAGTAWKGNAGYAAISCEVRPSTSGCADRPYVMFKHFDGLARYVAANGTLSPLGQTGTSDYNYYASAWALVRWAADLAPAEATFFRTLTRGPAVGVANLEGVAARPWGEMLADWSMSLALDDHPQFAAVRDQRIATWNLRDVFAGMNRDFPASYPRAHPLAAHAATFGAFTAQGSALRAGSAAFVQITGGWVGPQVLELRLPGGGAPSPALRLAVTRVQ